jgi:hypothetical protein
MTLFQKLEKIALDKNVSLAEIRDCIGKHYFYDIKSERGLAGSGVIC